MVACSRHRFLALGVMFGASAALADTGDIVAPSDPENPQTDSGWQAGTCFKDVPTCSVATPDQFFEQTAGHPQVGFTQIIVKHQPGLVGPEEPTGELKTVRVDLPVGLSVNPQATPQCATVTEPASCPGDTQVGYSEVTASALGVPFPPVEGVTKVPVFNMVPEEGQPALFGFELAGNNVYLRANVGLGRRLPRGLHDRRAGSASGSACRRSRTADGRKRADPEKPPRLRRPLGQRDLHHDAEHLLRPGRHVLALPPPLLDLAARRLLRRARSRPSPTAPPTSSPASRPKRTRKNATRFPSTRRSASTRTPPRPTRRAARRSPSTCPSNRRRNPKSSLPA